MFDNVMTFIRKGLHIFFFIYSSSIYIPPQQLSSWTGISVGIRNRIIFSIFMCRFGIFCEYLLMLLDKYFIFLMNMKLNVNDITIDLDQYFQDSSFCHYKLAPL